MQNENQVTYLQFKARCFALAEKLFLDTWDSDVDELWEAGETDLTDEELGAKLREMHLR